MNYSEGQFQLSLLRAQYAIAQATTGVCKSDKRFHGDGTQFTEDENVKNWMNVASRHLQFAQVCLDNTYKSQSDDHV